MLGRWPESDGRRQGNADHGHAQHDGRRAPSGQRRAPVGRFLTAAALSMTGMLVVAACLRMPAAGLVVAGSAFAAATALFAVLLSRRHPHRRLGAANVVTTVRMAIVALLLGVLPVIGSLADVDVVLTVGAGALALTLDGVDGYLARRQGTASPFGASFDMEVDAAFGLVLALLAMHGPAGAIALLLGLPRYLFAIAAVFAPWLDGPLDERYSRKVVCVVQLIALLALQLPFLPPAVAIALVVVTGLSLVWSFGVDVRALRRRRVSS